MRPQVTLDQALDALDAGNLAEARALAKTLMEQGAATTDEAGGPAFVLGVAAYEEARESWARDKKTPYLLAARWLEDARDRGFPPRRDAQGMLLLGKALYHGDRIPASRPVLGEALRLAGDEKTKAEIHRLLADANLYDSVPRLDEALADNARYLACPLLASSQRDEGLLQRAHILLGMDRIGECVTTLDKIPSDSRNRADVVLLRGRLLMREAEKLKDQGGADARLEAQKRYEAAIKTLRHAQGVDTVGNQATRQALYLIGVCFVELGNARAAAEEFNRLRTVFPETSEALAADRQEAELNRLQGRNDAALACYRRLLGAITDPDDFSNPWFTLPEVRKQVTTAYDEYRRTCNYAGALQLAGMIVPLFPKTRPIEWRAETLREWGRTLLTRAATLPPTAAEAGAAEGREHLREAGRAYGQLAVQRITTREYPEDLWNSAECYLAGQDYASAARAFQRYLNNESRRRNPGALVGLGEALLALDRNDEAIASFEQCIGSHPNDSAAFRARLLAGRAYRAKGMPDRAEKLLDEILDGPGITPKSEVWLDALFELGELMHATGRFAEAIRRLDEAVGRQPESPRATRARYLIADSYRRAAAAVREKLRHDVVENLRVAHGKESRELLSAARERYEDLKDRLTARRQTVELTDLEERMLRNSYFALGDVLFDLEQYEEAIKTVRDHHEPLRVASRGAPGVRSDGPGTRAAEPTRACPARRATREDRSRADGEGHVPFTETTNQTREAMGGDARFARREVR